MFTRGLEIFRIIRMTNLFLLIPIKPLLRKYNFTLLKNMAKLTVIIGFQILSERLRDVVVSIAIHKTSDHQQV